MILQAPALGAKDKNAEKCIRMGITVMKMVILDVNRRFLVANCVYGFADASP